jgi:hypothetical protein
MPSYNPKRDITPTFLDRVAAWIATRGEVLAVLRYLGGGKDFALCHSLDELEPIIGLVPIGTDVVVFRDPQLPVRGRVTDAYIAKALDTRAECRISARAAINDSHSDLRETLLDWTGMEVALGLMPDFWVSNHEGMISAAKGGIDGSR